MVEERCWSCFKCNGLEEACLWGHPQDTTSKIHENIRTYWVVPVVHLDQYFVSMAKKLVTQGQCVSLIIICSPFLLYSSRIQIVLLEVLEDSSLSSPFIPLYELAVHEFFCLVLNLLLASASTSSCDTKVVKFTIKCVKRTSSSSF